MSGPSLVERLRTRHWISPDINGSILAERYIDPDCTEAADRIAELEAERDAERKVYHDNQWRQLKEMTAERDALRKALEPFAKIEPSSLFAGDGSEGDRYETVLVDGRKAEFTGLDLAAARSLLSEGIT